MRALLPDRAGATVAPGEVDQPRPQPHEALVRVEAFSVNRGETFQLEADRPGWRPGKDVAGLVVQAAADGSGPQAGRRVVGHPPSAGWAEYAAVPTSALAELPDGIATTTAAALPLAGLTALRLLRAAGSVGGRRVLLTGASGGVGHYLTELAAAAGAELTAVTATPERGRRLTGLGAARVVQSVTDADGPFDLVLESTGGAALPQALARLRPRGVLIWFGQASRTPVTLDFFDFFAGPESATVGHFHYLDDGAPLCDDLAAIVRLVDTGRLHPEVGLVEDWSSTAEVITRLRGREIRGNAVLTIDRIPATRGESTMPSTDPKTVVVGYVEAVRDGDAEVIRASFAEDATWVYPGSLPMSRTWTGRDVIVDEFLGGAGAKLVSGTLRIELTNAVAEGEQVFVEWSSDALGVNGVEYHNKCAGVFTVRDGHIISVREYADTHHVAAVMFSDGS
jgi:NADPH:quinone reductase-like Zn-dependent oxidoreductase/ketosteroid isomerase-like protein